MKVIKPIFIIGSPRSGTTLIGNYIGSCPSVCNLGEYGGFSFSYDIAVREFREMPTPYKDRYISELQEHALSFANKVTLEQGCRFYCDSTPWNLLIAKELANVLPNALFILTLRHYSGIVQSLERSYLDGYKWAGPNWSERAKLFCRFYDEAGSLPQKRIIPISYDKLCAEPKNTIASLKVYLAELGLEVSELDDGQFTQSHATNRTHQRPTLGFQSGAGITSFTSISSFDPQKWSKRIAEEVSPIVKNTDDLLRRLYPDVYIEPMDFPSLS